MKQPERFSKRWCGTLILFVLCCATPFTTTAQTVQDIFGRDLNEAGLTLVDWDGYMANPLITFYVFPPTNAVLPVEAALSADGARLYFDMPSTVSPDGPNKVVNFTDANTGVPVRISIFPAHQDADADHTLTIVFTDANNTTTTTTLPIRVLDQDSHRTNDFVVTPDFSQDMTGFFTNDLARALVDRAANDWTYYFTGMNLDTVAAGAEQTFIWSNNFDGGYYVNNAEAYTGYLLYAYGTSNDIIRSGGEGSFNGNPQTSGGVPLTMNCSGGFEANIDGNFNTFGWLFLTNDDDWLASGNLGTETNDFFSIAHHEIGHALIFNEAHAGFATALANGQFSSDAVTNYYGGPVPIDSSNDHLTGIIDPESGQGAFGYEYYGVIPRYRWTMTKLDLFCAQEVGYVLRPTSAFAPFTLGTNPPTTSLVGAAYTNNFVAVGGIPIYDWEITSGALPSGLALDSFTGALTGTPLTNGIFHFTVRVRDYHPAAPGLSQDVTLSVIPASVQLTLSVTRLSGSDHAQLVLAGPAGQHQVIQISTNLIDWQPLATNITGTNVFQVTEINPPQTRSRYYRAVISTSP